MSRFLRRLGIASLAVAGALAAGCGGGPPRHVADPVPDAPPPILARDEAPLGGSVEVRVGLHAEPGSVRIEAPGGVTLGRPGGELRELGGGVRVSTRGGGESADVVVANVGGAALDRGPGPWEVRPAGEGFLRVGERRIRGRVEISARRDSLFVVAVLPLEDYLRGVVPREIGPRPATEVEAVAAQAVAARTYSVRRLGQYGSLPFDLFADVRDQVYEGVDGEHAVADEAIRETAGLILTDADGPIEAYYSSTCGGRRSDLEAVWPWREGHRALRGGPDGPKGAEWCRESPHFRWTETWDGGELSRLVRRHLPELTEPPVAKVGGDLTDVKIVRRGPSGRAAEIEWKTTEGRWIVRGDRNRWILRRPGGGILRSVGIDLDVERRGGRVTKVVATGRGNGHGVGMCQTGAIGRARAGRSFRQILSAYYPGTRIRAIRGGDLPEGRGRVP